MAEFRLFEEFGGLLREIAPEQAEARKVDWPVDRINCVIEVLWTPERKKAAEDAQALEDAAAQARADAVAKAAAEARTAASAQAEATAAAKESAAAKLRAFGLDESEIGAILGP
jgi:hypothetical protein